MLINLRHSFSDESEPYSHRAVIASLSSYHCVVIHSLKHQCGCSVSSLTSEIMTKECTIYNRISAWIYRHALTTKVS
jgi:hypothetical protein